MIPSVSVLQLVKRQDADNTDVNSVDLMSLPIELQYEGWQQATPQQQGQPSVDDVITLLMNAGDDNALAAALQSIDTKVKEVQWAQDPLNPIGVWLRSRLSGESNARQAFILAARRSPALRVTDPLAYDSILQQYQLGITRAPMWENVLAQNIAASTISAHGGTIAYTVAGDAHARIAQAIIAGSSSYTFNEVWLGVKTNRYGVNPANFAPQWDMSAAALDTDTTRTADATAVGGFKGVCTFGTVSTMTTRSLVTVDYASANVSDQRGKYIAVLRAKTTDASLVVNVRIGQGYQFGSTVASGRAFAYRPMLQISAANVGWRYYTLGSVKIPATDGYFNLPLTRAGLALQAQKVSGSGNFEFNDIVLIPSEHCIHLLSTSTISAVPTAVRKMYINTRPDQKIYGVMYSQDFDAIIDAPPPDAINWSIPAGTGVIVCLGSSTSSNVNDQFRPSFTLYPSYSSLRGAS